MRQSSDISTRSAIDRALETVKTGARFGVVGAFASAVHLGVALLVLALGINVMVANSVGFCTALVVSVVGHHSVSFPGRTSFWRGARRFIPAAIVGFVANNVLLAALVAATGSSYAWLKVAVAILIIPPATFAYAYFFAYRN